MKKEIANYCISQSINICKKQERLTKLFLSDKITSVKKSYLIIRQMNKYLKAIVKILQVLVATIVIYETIFAITFAHFPKNFNSLMRTFKYYPDSDIPFPNYNLGPIGFIMSDGSYALLKYAGVFDLLMGDRLFITSAEYRVEFGIENARLSASDENRLHEMINEIVNAEAQYYKTGKEDNIEKVRDLFILDERYEQFKKDVKADSDSYKIVNGKIKKIIFSNPRKYKSLNDRTGILSHTKFDISNSSDSSDTLLQLYIFKLVDNKWKIEICSTDAPFGIENTEEGYLQQLTGTE